MWLVVREKKPWSHIALSSRRLALSVLTRRPRLQRGFANIELRGFSTIGAGDTFLAGMLYGLHADAWSHETKLGFAVGLATKKVQQEGFAGLVP